MAYVMTEDEQRVIKECSQDCFWYGALPMSAGGMLVTQMFLKKGILTTHSRYGAFPKIAFAGIFGFFIGKVSCMKSCLNKLKNLENSPLGEALRQQKPVLPGYSPQNQGFSNVPSSSHFETSSAAEAPPSSTYSGDHSGMEYSHSTYEPIPFSSSMNESTPTGIADNVPQEPGPSFEPSPKRKEIMYDELRKRNRELYEAGITQKSELPSKSPQERLPKKEVKVNKYGDTWEE